MGANQSFRSERFSRLQRGRGRHQGGKPEDGAEERRRAALRLRRGDGDVDGVRERAREAGERIRDEERERVQLGDVTDVRRKKAVQAHSGTAVREDGDAVCQGREQRERCPEREPGDMRQRQERAKEHGDP